MMKINPICCRAGACYTAGAGGAGHNETKDWNLGLDYNKYLQEIVQVNHAGGRWRLVTDGIAGHLDS